ncbi:MAG: hypothetical protein GMKNLPBB_00679 [Myxococcota bacterium]|nr:hypothetical protein [Myxococcota bacterium]
MTAPYETLITESIVVRMYNTSIARYGGMESKPKDGCIKAVLGNAWNAAYYHWDEDENPGGLVFAAFVFMYFMHDHCYGDGNKRIAWMTMTYLLKKQFNLTLHATDEEAEGFCLAVIKDKLAIETILEWMNPRLAIDMPE